MTTQSVEEIVEAMGSVLIPGSQTIQARLVISPELMAKMATAARDLLVEQGWRTIDSAPRDGRTVLVAVHTAFYGWVRGYARWDGARGIYGWISQGFTDPPGNLGLGNPSHWRPLPAAPGGTDDHT